MFQFKDPYAFILLLIIPFLYKSIFSKRDKSNNSIPFLAGSGTPELTLPFYLEYRNYILFFLQSVAIIFLVTALTRPQMGSYITEDFSEGRDLLITVDASGSMKALDFKISGKNVDRLYVLKNVVNDFIKERSGDRIGLIVFGEEVYTQSPLTSDHDLLIKYLEEIEIGMAGDSTALGDALALSIKRLRDIPSESKAIILVTDGIKSSGQMEPVQAAEIAKKLGIRVYTIGIGGKDPAPFPLKDVFGREHLKYINIPVDEKSLEKIALITGGKYFNATNSDQLYEIYSQIDKLELRKEPDTRFVAQKEYFAPFILAGLIVILLTEILSRTLMRVIS